MKSKTVEYGSRRSEEGVTMKRFSLLAVLAVLAALWTALAGSAAYAQQDVPRMTKEDLQPLLANPDVIVIDVRAKSDWEGDALMVRGAVREDPSKVESWMEKYPKDKTLVFYCA